MQPLLTLETILDKFCMLCLPKNVAFAVQFFPEEEKLIIFTFSIKIESPERTCLTTRRPQGTVGHGAVRRLRFKIRKNSFQGQIFARNSKMDTKFDFG